LNPKKGFLYSLHQNSFIEFLRRFIFPLVPEALLDIFLNENPNPATTTFCALFDREKDIFTQTAFEALKSMSKMKTYRFLKQSWKGEDYLFRTGNVSDRTALTKLRLSDHTLTIEKGRHQNINESDRTCPFCPGQMENEFNFLTKCPTFKYLRKSLIDDVEVLCIGFSYPQDQDFLIWLLLIDPIISDSAGKFIQSSMEMRAFLLEQHRSFD